MNTAHLTSCHACAAYSENGGQVAAYVTDVPQPRPWYCPRCLPGLVPADQLAVPNAEVTLVDHNPGTRYVVLARDGDRVTVRVLGLTCVPARTVHIDEVMPRFSYAQLEAARRVRK